MERREGEVPTAEDGAHGRSSGDVKGSYASMHSITKCIYVLEVGFQLQIVIKFVEFIVPCWNSVLSRVFFY